MAGRAFVSRFSPNRTAPETLEAIFVQRHTLAEVWLERLRDSVLGGAKHHLLAVGPRGCGKSHLVVLLLSRLKKDPVVRERLRIAWLPEDETTSSFWKFLLRILRALNAEYGDEFPPPPRDQLDNAADDRRTAVLTDYLLKKLGTRNLLVVVENLDDAMRGLKLEGQKRWRAFLQEHPVAITLATAQQLTKDVSDRDRPFFNFFQIERLQPLTADEAVELLKKLAERGGNATLAAFLQTATGRARVRAIRHIAGGSHRVFIILSEFATRENLDDLVTAFEELLDELTPYYQERLRWLPDQQREIVEFLCRQIHTVPVKEIATELFLSDQAGAAQLKSLKDKGYVTAESVGRESRYELTEPLMRLCVEVKDPQHEPIRLIVEFLRIWYDRAGVEDWLQRLPVDAELERRYFHAALQTHRPDIPGPVEEALNRDLQSSRATGNPEEVVRVLVELAAIADTTWKILAVAKELSDLGHPEEALAACDRAIKLDPSSAIAFHNRGWALEYLGRREESLVAYDRAIALAPDDFQAWYGRSWALFNLSCFTEALSSCERAIEIEPDSVEGDLLKASALQGLGRHEEALNAWQRVIERDPEISVIWVIYARMLSKTGKHGEALAAYNRAIELDPDCGTAWGEKGNELRLLGRNAEAAAIDDHVIALDPADAYPWIIKGYSLGELNRHEEALAACDRAIHLNPSLSIAWMLKGWMLNKLGRHEEALAAFRQIIETDSTNTVVWTNSGWAKFGLGRTNEALDDLNQAIALGASFPIVFEMLATVHVRMGRWDKAEQALIDLFRLPPPLTPGAMFWYLPDLIATVFRTSTDRKVWAHRVARLVELGADAQKDRERTNGAKTTISPPKSATRAPAPPAPLAMIGDSLVRSLTNKVYAEATADALDDWASVWREVAKQHPDLSLAVRLFGVGLRYVQKNDERVLLDLVRDERSILRELFGLGE